MEQVLFNRVLHVGPPFSTVAQNGQIKHLLERVCLHFQGQAGEIFHKSAHLQKSIETFIEDISAYLRYFIWKET